MDLEIFARKASSSAYLSAFSFEILFEETFYCSFDDFEGGSVGQLTVMS